MTAEDVEMAADLVEKGGRFIGRVRDHKVEKKKRFKRKGMKKDSPSAFPLTGLQRLFLACQDVFKGPQTVPSSSDVLSLRRILDAMVPEDVGLHRGQQIFKSRNVVEGEARVVQAPIYHSTNFSISLFFLPASAVIPLHDHPRMTVFSKLLLGTLHKRAYDWVEPSALPNKPRLARLKTKEVLSAPCDSSVLYPTCGGNIHELKAITPCAVLDVLGPPYSQEDGRDCSYYKDAPCGDGDLLVADGEMDKAGEKGTSGLALLEEIEMPEEAKMEDILYKGPSVYGFPWH